MARNKIPITALFVSAIFAPVLVVAQSGRSAPDRDGAVAFYGESSARSTLPFSLYRGYLVVFEGRIATLKGMRFLLDSGVTHSVIDRKLAERLGLSGPPANMANFDRVVSASWATVPEIEFGPTLATKFPMLVGDLEYLRPDAGRVDAVIGLDLLRKTSFGIDYGSKELEFGHFQRNGSKVRMVTNAICLTVEVMIGNGVSRLVVDTGMSGILLYEDRLGVRVSAAQDLGPASGFTISGQLRGRRAVIPRIQLGQMDIDRRVVLMHGPPSKLLPGIDGYLGTSALEIRKIVFDFDTGTLGWQR
jgi:predicted aspartyl protease